MRCSCRFGGVLHDWPEGYFKAQQSKGNALAGIFKQAMSQNQAQKITRSRSIISRMFSGGSALSRLKSLTVRTNAGHLTCLLPVLHPYCRQNSLFVLSASCQMNAQATTCCPRHKVCCDWWQLSSHMFWHGCTSSHKSVPLVNGTSNNMLTRAQSML